jgi:hypothetical protein
LGDFLLKSCPKSFLITVTPAYPGFKEGNQLLAPRLASHPDIRYIISNQFGGIPMKVLVSIPDSLYTRMMATIPPRQRSKLIAKLLEDEVKKREQELYQAALAVEQDEELNAEMKDWDVTMGDGIE